MFWARRNASVNDKLEAADPEINDTISVPLFFFDVTLNRG
jgi:hypothetical protein